MPETLKELLEESAKTGQKPDLDSLFIGRILGGGADLHEKVKCPKCGQNTMFEAYAVIDGGSCDTSEWKQYCPVCGYENEHQSPNTSDFAY